MNLRLLRKKTQSNFANLIALSRIDLLFKPYYSGLGSILMFHRVIPKSNRLRIHNHLSLEISPEQLEKIILFYKRKNYNFISLETLPQYLRKPQNNKFAVFTFDDGYIDNYEYALPIFKKHNIPFTIYVATGFPDKSIFIWWYFLEELLINHKELILHFDGTKQIYQCENYEQKEQAFNKIRRIIIDHNEDKNFISNLFSDYSKELINFSKTPFSMSWSQIKELSINPLVTIGAHTINHKALNNLDKESLINEIKGSQERIYKKTGKLVHHFAFPFGSKKEIGKREIKLMEELDFETSATTILGNIFKEHKEEIFSLPRLNINLATNDAILRLMSNGFIPALLNRFKRIITI